MRKFFPVLICCFFIFGSISTTAQTTPSGKAEKKKPPVSKTKPFDISKADFQNLTYPVPLSSGGEATFTLRNGTAAKTENMPNFSLRKTYYFDLTGDGLEEAITHILADGCQMGCGNSSLFFIYTPVNNQPKLLWKIAVGGDTMGGLKAANFNVGEIILDTFGDCSLDGWLINPRVDVKTNPELKTKSYTRFVFTGGANGFTKKTKEIYPLTQNINFSQYTAMISFGIKE